MAEARRRATARQGREGRDEASRKEAASQVEPPQKASIYDKMAEWLKQETGTQATRAAPPPHAMLLTAISANR
jgi:hypothetical protein